MNISRRTMILGTGALVLTLGRGVGAPAGAAGRPLVQVYKDPT